MALVEAGELLIVLPVPDDSNLSGIGVFAGDGERVAGILDGDPASRPGSSATSCIPLEAFPAPR